MFSISFMWIPILSGNRTWGQLLLDHLFLPTIPLLPLMHGTASQPEHLQNATPSLLIPTNPSLRPTFSWKPVTQHPSSNTLIKYNCILFPHFFLANISPMFPLHQYLDCKPLGVQWLIFSFSVKHYINSYRSHYAKAGIHVPSKG